MSSVIADPSSIMPQKPRGEENDGLEKSVIEKNPSSLSHPGVLQGDGCRIIPSAEFLKLCQAALSGKTTELWGQHIRAGSVTLFTGETSAGKTVFLHNLAHHLAAGEEFLGLGPPRSLRVLYVDFESNEEILVQHLTAIGAVEGWDFFDLTETQRGPVLLENLRKATKDRLYDVLIIDPLIEALPVKDENDNSQGSMQMLAFRRLAKDTGAGIVLVHNAGRKGIENKDGKFFGRGATSRVDRADVSINFTVKGPVERELFVAKSRGSNLNERLVIRFADELSYELVEASAPTQVAIVQWQVDIVTLVEAEASQGRIVVKRKLMMEHFGIEEGTKESVALDRALVRNVTSGKLVKVGKGSYALPSCSEHKR